MPIAEKILQRLRANDTGLTSLDLNRKSLTDADIQILVTENRTLTELNLWGSEIGDEKTKVLAEHETLTTLYLGQNGITINRSASFS